MKEQERDWGIVSLLMNQEVGFSRASHTLQVAKAAEAEATLDGILQRVEKKRKRLPREAVEVPSLVVFKVRLGNLI